MWKYTGNTRPPFAETPGPGQESCWDYPRPPRLEKCSDAVEVCLNHVPLASSRAVLRVLETASPPTYYLPSTDIVWDTLTPIAGQSFCEWKGIASYYALAQQPDIPVAWLYRQPSASFAAIDQHVSFYPGRLECYVNDERVQPQPGEFYGGWITSRVSGPFKGGPGTSHW